MPAATYPTALAGHRSPDRNSLQQLAFDALVAALATSGAVIARLLIERTVGGVAPFILSFPAVMLATLVSGGRAGTIAAFSCQLLTLRYVFPNWVSTHGGITTDLANVVLSTFALAGTVWATTSARQTAVTHQNKCERRARTLSLVIAEMNHRTKNNFQVAASLLAHQSMSSIDHVVSTELNAAASRLEAIAAVYDDLSFEEPIVERIELSKHLGRVIRNLRAGALSEHVDLGYRGDLLEVPQETAAITGLIVNEWITNALRHAFRGQAGRINVELRKDPGCVRIVVQDDGPFEPPVAARGKGSDLVESLAEVLNALVTIESKAGRRCSLFIPDDRVSAR